MQESVTNINKLRIECVSCETVVITDIGKSVYNCPVCNQTFDIRNDSNYNIQLKKALESLKSVSGAKFSFICEEE